MKQGDDCFDEDGNAYGFVASTPAGAVVRPLYEYDNEPRWGEPVIVGKVYAIPPKQKCEGEIAKLREIESELRAKMHERQQGLASLERDSEARMAAIKRHKGLERLELFLSGKITHFVIDNYSRTTIATLEQATKNGDAGERRWDKKLRLLSLYGDSNGNLEWNLNRHYDGSGSNTKVIPCTSEEEAKAIIGKICDEQWEASRKSGSLAYAAQNAIASAIAAGLEVPADIVAMQTAKAAGDKASAIKEAEERLAKAKAMP